MKKLKNLLQCNYFYYVLLFMSILYLILYISYHSYEYKYELNDSTFEVNILNYTIIEDKLSIELKGKEKLIGTYYFKDNEEIIKFKDTYKFNDKIKVKGKLLYPKNNTIPNLFNYKKYLLYKNIRYILYIENIEKISDNKSILYKIKNYVYDRVDKIESNEYMYAFILGNSKYISEEAMNNYRINTITHLFAISGMHVSIFASLISKILNRFSKKISFIITIIFLTLLCFITNNAPSILRAIIFYFFLNLYKLLNIKAKSKCLLFLTFSIMILVNPHYVYSLGFILSFTVVYFMLLSSETIKIKNKILSILTTSIVSMICSFPIIINSFNSINLIGFINNIFFIPFVSYVVYPFSLLTLLFPFLNKLLELLTFIMEHISNILASILNINITMPKFSVGVIIIFYILLVIIIKYKKKFALVLLLILLIFQYNICKFNKNNYLYFLDVGQGDSILLKLENKNILIDTSGKINYKNNNNFNIMIDNIIPFLYSKGIKKLDYLLITHGDFDHMGDAINLVENFKVEKVIFNCGEFNRLEQELIKVLEKNKMPYYSCIKELNVGDNKLYFLNNKDYGNENDNSSVIYTELNNRKFLFMGDAGVEVEEDLIKKYNFQDIDVLKVGHHGSRTSSSKSFIDEINPKYSIISVGKNNRYGHPNKEVLDNLKDSKIYRTDQDGSIMFKIKNNKLKIDTCSP